LPSMFPVDLVLCHVPLVPNGVETGALS
jgi:hypothetical protein